MFLQNSGAAAFHHTQVGDAYPHMVIGARTVQIWELCAWKFFAFLAARLSASQKSTTQIPEAAKDPRLRDASNKIGPSSGRIAL